MPATIMGARRESSSAASWPSSPLERTDQRVPRRATGSLALLMNRPKDPSADSKVRVRASAFCFGDGRERGNAGTFWVPYAAVPRGGVDSSEPRNYAPTPAAGRLVQLVGHEARQPSLTRALGLLAVGALRLLES